MNDDRAIDTVDDADFQKISGTIGTHEHRQSFVEVVDEDRMVERMEYVIIVDAVPASAGCDQWDIQTDNLAGAIGEYKLTCANVWRPGRCPGSKDNARHPKVVRACLVLAHGDVNATTRNWPIPSVTDHAEAPDIDARNPDVTRPDSRADFRIIWVPAEPR